MVANPKLMPVMVGCVVGAVAPAAMKMLAGVMVTLEVSLLPSIMVTPPATAGLAMVTGKVADCPRPTVAFAGMTIAPALPTVTLAVVSGIFGSALAWMVAVPTETPVTGTLTVTAFAGKVTVAGIVATPLFDELRLTTWPPAGAGVESVRVMF